MFIQPVVTFKVGHAVVTLEDVPIFGSAERRHEGFGNLDGTSWRTSRALTLDFQNMRFSLGLALSSSAGTAR
jgi:hypothetical protein